jgi:DNA-binding MarR family transcriptional regulator
LLIIRLLDINLLDIKERGAVKVPEKKARPGLGYLVKWIERGVRVELDAALRPLEIAAPGYTALSVLRDGRELSSAQLARRTFVSAQAMHPIVLELERRGLVTRRGDVSNARVQLVRLSASGRALLAACDRACAAAEERMFGELSASEREALRKMLQKCAAAMSRGKARGSEAA